jgi:hypothetical protein
MNRKLRRHSVYRKNPPPLLATQAPIAESIQRDHERHVESRELSARDNAIEGAVKKNFANPVSSRA